MPKFSVVVPVYKVENYLRECVDSVLNQKYADFEIILIDDGSPDGCPAICDEYAAKDGRVKVIHKKNTGVSDSRNCGIEAAQGEYFWFVDSDDYIVDDAFSILLHYLESEPDILTFGRASITNDDRSTFSKDAFLLSGLYSGEKKEEMLAYINGKNLLPFCWSSIYKASFIKEKNIRFDKRLSYGEDAVFNFEAFLRSEEMLFIEEHLYAYRVRSTGASRTIKKDFDFAFAQQLELNCGLRDELYEKYSAEPKKEYYQDKGKFVLITVFSSILISRIYNSSYKNKYKLFKKISKSKMIRDAFRWYDINLIKTKSIDWKILWFVKHRMYLAGHMLCKFILFKK